MVSQTDIAHCRVVNTRQSSTVNKCQCKLDNRLSSIKVRPTMLAQPLNYHLNLQSQASYGYSWPIHKQKVKVKGHSAQKLVVNRWTDGADCITWFLMWLVKNLINMLLTWHRAAKYRPIKRSCNMPENNNLTQINTIKKQKCNTKHYGSAIYYNLLSEHTNHLLLFTISIRAGKW